MNFKDYQNNNDIKNVREVMQERNCEFTEHGMSRIQENPKQAWHEMVSLLLKNGPTRHGIEVERIVTALVRMALNDPHWEPESN